MSDLIVLNRSRDFSHGFLIYCGIIWKVTQAHRGTYSDKTRKASNRIAR